MSKMPVVWEWDVGTKFCVLTKPQNVEKDYDLATGVSRANGFPADACFRMDPKFKKFVALADNPKSMGGTLVISKRLKEFIEGLKPQLVEYLQVPILNHQGDVASADYFIMNPLRIFDCINKDKSDIRWNPLDKEKISGCSKLVLKPKSFDEKALLFRPQHLEYAVIVDRKLAEAITGEGFTGTRFTELDEYVN